MSTEQSAVHVSQNAMSEIRIDAKNSIWVEKMSSRHISRISWQILREKAIWKIQLLEIEM
jgi:hypothetical protein